MAGQIYHGFVEMKGKELPRIERLVVWSFEGCASVTDALGQAVRFFEQQTGESPRYGFVRRMPGEEVFREVGEVMVLEAEWMLERCVAVGG